MKRKEDLRIIRTNLYLSDALLSLIETKSLDSITVREICTKAVVNRTTFYSHFKSVRELYESIIDTFMERVCYYLSMLSDNTNEIATNTILINFLKYISDNSKIFELVYNNSINLDYQRQNYKEFIKKVSKKYENRIQNTDYITNYFVQSGGAIINTWLTSGKKESPDEVATIISNLIMKGLRSYEKKPQI